MRPKIRRSVIARHLPMVFLMALMAVTFLGVSRPPTVLAATNVFNFRMGHNEPIGSPMNNAYEEWVKILKERSGGRLNPSNFPAGQTGNYAQNIEANRLGTIEVTSGGLDTEGKLSPVTSVLGLGYIVNSYEQVDKVFQGPLGKMLSEEMKKRTGVYVIAYGEAGFRNILSKKPILKLDDLKGGEDPCARDADQPTVIQIDGRKCDTRCLCRDVHRSPNRSCGRCGGHDRRHPRVQIL